MSDLLTRIGFQNATGGAQIVVQSPVPAGSLIIVFVCDTNPGGSSGASFSDSVGNSYANFSQNVVGGGYVGIQYAVNSIALPVGAVLKYTSPLGLNKVALVAMFTPQALTISPVTTQSANGGTASCTPYVISETAFFSAPNPGDLLVACAGSPQGVSFFQQADGWLGSPAATDISGPTLGVGFVGSPSVIQISYDPVFGTAVPWAGLLFSFSMQNPVPPPVYSWEPQAGVLMGSVQQSGAITPGHGAQWLAPGVLGDAGSTLAGEKVLGKISGANFNTTNDQPIVIPQSITAFMITRIVITNASTSLTTAAGGIYSQAAKGGTAIVASGQAYSALTAAASLMQATLASFGSGTRFSASNLGLLNGLLVFWLSLTTPQGGAAQADVYVCGIDLSA